MDEIKQIIDLLEMNMKVMSQVSSVYKRTQEALKLARVVDQKIDGIERLLVDMEGRIIKMEGRNSEPKKISYRDLTATELHEARFKNKQPIISIESLEYRDAPCYYYRVWYWED